MTALTPAPFTKLPAHRAGVVLADPPWSFTTYGPKGWRKSAHAHYPCMDPTGISALPVTGLAAPDSCSCFGAHRSTYRRRSRSSTVGASPSDRRRMGEAVDARSAVAVRHRLSAPLHREFFLVGTRGRPQQLRSSRNLIVAPVREHSRKPDEIYELIEATWPGPYVDCSPAIQELPGANGPSRLLRQARNEGPRTRYTFGLHRVGRARELARRADIPTRSRSLTGSSGRSAGAPGSGRPGRHRADHR